MNTSTAKIARMGLLCAISVVLILLIRFPLLPAASFLIYEPGDVPIILGSFMFGPISGLVMTVVVAVVQAIISGQDVPLGPLMHIIATGTLVMVSGYIYKYFRNIYGAVAGLILGSVSMLLIMIPSNLFFDVRFYNYTYESVKALIPTAIIPFNAIKSGINSLLAFLLYLPLNSYLNIDGKGQKRSLI